MSNVNQPAFKAEGPTAFLNVGTASVNVQVHNGSSKHVRVANPGTNLVYIRDGFDGTVAAAIPAVGAPAWGMPVCPGSEEVIRAPGGWVAVISAVVGPTPVLFTPGEGL